MRPSEQGRTIAFEKVGYELPSSLVKATKQIGIEEKILLKHLVEDALRDLVSLYQSQKQSVGYNDNGDRYLSIFRDHIANAQHTPTYTAQDHDLLKAILKLRKAQPQAVTVIERMIYTYIAEVLDNETREIGVREKTSQRGTRHTSSQDTRVDTPRNEASGSGFEDHFRPHPDVA